MWFLQELLPVLITGESMSIKPKPITIGPKGPHQIKAYTNRPPNHTSPNWMWTIQQRVNGQRKRVSIQRVTREEAERIAWDYYRQQDLFSLDVSGITTVDCLLNAYFAEVVEPKFEASKSAASKYDKISKKTIEHKKGTAKWLIRVGGEIELQDCQAIENLLFNKKAIKYAPSTRQAAKVLLKQAIKWCNKNGGSLPSYDIPLINTQKEVGHIPKEGDIQSYIENEHDQEYKLFVLLTYITGGRSDAIATLNGERLIYDGDILTHIHLIGKKNPRLFPIKEHYRPKLRTLLPKKLKKAEGLFKRKSINNSVLGAIRKVAAKHGFEPFTIQAIRRLKAAQLYSRIPNEKEYEALMGHTKKTALEYYLKATEEDKIKAIELLPNEEWLK